MLLVNNKKLKNIKKKPIICILVMIIICSIWILYDNMTLELNEYSVSSKKIPETFDGYKIAHVSDLHNAEIGKENEKLLNLLRNANPDIIVITGDIVDSRNTNIEIALDFVKESMQIAPCYYVTGNHEARVSEYEEFKTHVEAIGVSVLENEQMELEQNGECITILGVDDPSFTVDYLLGDSNSLMESRLEEIITDEDDYRILLSHRPELFDLYVKYDMDLVFTGHAHGGQFRLPFIGGIIAPNQGFFPEYDAGLYYEDNTTMIVSRGIGNSLFPFRVNNPPEVVLIELRREK